MILKRMSRLRGKLKKDWKPDGWSGAGVLKVLEHMGGAVKTYLYLHVVKPTSSTGKSPLSECPDASYFVLSGGDGHSLFDTPGSNVFKLLSRLIFHIYMNLSENRP